MCEVDTHFESYRRLSFCTVSVRWNEAKLKEIQEETETSTFRQRASRLAKWREMAEQAAAQHRARLELPNTIEILRVQFCTALFKNSIFHCFNFFHIFSFFSMFGTPLNSGVIFWHYMRKVIAIARSGHVVVALVPKFRGGGCKTCVGIVTAVWMCVKKPRLATTSIPIDHAVAVRIIEMTNPKPNQPTSFECNGNSNAWVVLPQSVIAVLDLDGYEQAIEKYSVNITQTSVDLLGSLSDLPEWWPTLDEDVVVADKKKKPHHPLLFVHRQGRRRARAKATAKAKASAKKVKVFVKKVKKADAEIPAETANFRRTVRGDTLIRQMMEKVRVMDCKIFAANPLFSMEGNTCRLNTEKCKDKPWSSFAELAPAFFRAELLGLLGMVWDVWECLAGNGRNIFFTNVLMINP